MLGLEQQSGVTVEAVGGWRSADTALEHVLCLVYVVDDGQPYITTGYLHADGTWVSNFTLGPIQHGRVALWHPIPNWPVTA